MILEDTGCLVRQKSLLHLQAREVLILQGQISGNLEVQDFRVQHPDIFILSLRVPYLPSQNTDLVCMLSRRSSDFCTSSSVVD